ncbi:hypothetical protein SAMN04488029_3889 [Reichenbachiella faecimaris]|uniref:TolB-like 6-blade propeller-like n=1 Tax=Reichenbachiella faecimaris TaxID=692418 RepID=A0A1W2GQ47_REIFA|nr:hypothetical protein [Reichenbachiella faecimaris]SMD38810.1 hypothetical protein SAMN04488029_3889 [Reichenbachiella faecimaris]
MAVKNVHHQITFDFPIKSIIPGSDENLLLIETYDAEAKSQTFLLLSFQPLEIIQAISFGEEYSGLVAKSYDAAQLLFIQYSDQNNPDLTNIYTFSWNGGDPTFSLQNTRIIQSGSEWIKVPHPHFANKEIYVDLKSGTELRTAPVSGLAIFDNVSYATSYTVESEYFQWFVQYFAKYNIIPCRQIEYLKANDAVLISYYEERENGLVNTLVILDNEGEILESILLVDELSGIGKDTFFVYRNKAIFVTQKNTLNIYDL